MENSIVRLKTFVNMVIEQHKDEEKNFFGMSNSTLPNALNKVITANIDLINAIKVTRATLTSPASIQKQITIFTKIKNDMLALQKTLSSPLKSPVSNEARNLLTQAAMFIETTAAKAVKDAQALQK